MELILDIKQLGPVKDSRIVWRPLTVFIGPNNTGKTYTAYLIHVLLSTYPDQCGLGEKKISELFLDKHLKFNFETIKEQWIKAWKKKLKDQLKSFWEDYFGIKNKIPELEIKSLIEEKKEKKTEFKGEIPIFGVTEEINENSVLAEQVGTLYYICLFKKK